jgi:hypothetical protein
VTDSKRPKHPLPDDERRVFERMKDWADELNSLMGMYTDNGQMPRERSEAARTAYRNVKDGLRAEYKRHSANDGRTALTPAERRWYERTVHQAMTQLRAPISAAPEKWFSGVYSAHSDFKMEMHRMNEVYDIPQEWLK